MKLFSCIWFPSSSTVIDSKTQLINHTCYAYLYSTLVYIHIQIQKCTYRESTIRCVDLDRRHIKRNKHQEEFADSVSENENEQRPPKRHRFQSEQKPRRKPISLRETLPLRLEAECECVISVFSTWK